MALWPLLGPLHRRAVLWGAVAWFALYIVFVVIAPNLSSDDVSRPSLAPRSTMAIALLSYLIPGIVTGYMARRSPLMHGAILGLLAGAGPAVLVVLAEIVTSPWIASPSDGLSQAWAWQAVVPHSWPCLIFVPVATAVTHAILRRRSKSTPSPR